MDISDKERKQVLVQAKRNIEEAMFYLPDLFEQSLWRVIGMVDKEIKDTK